MKTIKQKIAIRQTSSVEFGFGAGVFKPTKISIKKNRIFSTPPTKNVKSILKTFRNTRLYNTRFLKSLEKGLRRSSYFNEDNAASSRN
jgi:hypothetical protein